MDAGLDEVQQEGESSSVETGVEHLAQLEESFHLLPTTVENHLGGVRLGHVIESLLAC